MFLEEGYLSAKLEPLFWPNPPISMFIGKIFLNWGAQGTQTRNKKHLDYKDLTDIPLMSSVRHWKVWSWQSTESILLQSSLTYYADGCSNHTIWNGFIFGLRRLLKEQTALASGQSPALNSPISVHIITFCFIKGMSLKILKDISARNSHMESTGSRNLPMGF